MIIDIILERKDHDDAIYGGLEDARTLYTNAMLFGFLDLARALDSGTEEDVKRELCRYIDTQGYDPSLKEYINSVMWVEGYDYGLKEFIQNYSQDGPYASEDI